MAPSTLLHVLRALLVIAISGFVSPALADETSHSPSPVAAFVDKPIVRDVALSAGGVLTGRLVGVKGMPLAGEQIAAIRDGQIRGDTKTAADGTFRIGGLQGGTYQLAFMDTAQPCRLWAPGTAPPGAPKTVVVSVREPAIRGQSPPFRTRPQFRRAATVAGLLGIGWAVYEALDEETPPGS